MGELQYAKYLQNPNDNREKISINFRKLILKDLTGNSIFLSDYFPLVIRNIRQARINCVQ